MRLSKLVPPVAKANWNHRELCKNDGPSNCRSHLLGALHSETNVTAEVAHSNEGLEPRALTSTRLLLYRHDLEHLVFESRSQKVVDDFTLFDRNGEEIDILQTLDFPVLHKTTKLSYWDPLRREEKKKKKKRQLT